MSRRKRTVSKDASGGCGSGGGDGTCCVMDCRLSLENLLPKVWGDEEEEAEQAFKSTVSAMTEEENAKSGCVNQSSHEFRCCESRWARRKRRVGAGEMGGMMMLVSVCFVTWMSFQIGPTFGKPSFHNWKITRRFQFSSIKIQICRDV